MRPYGAAARWNVTYVNIATFVKSTQKPIAQVATRRRLRPSATARCQVGTRYVPGTYLARTWYFSGGSHRHNPTAMTSAAPARNTNARCQSAYDAISPALARPTNPPTIVPDMYAAVARPARSAGHISWMYATLDANTPGVTTPCANRHAISCASVVDVAASSVAAARRNADPTMTRRRPTVSASRPTSGAKIATPTVGAVTVRPTANGDAWNTRAKSGSSGCVAYRFRNADAPARTIGHSGGNALSLYCLSH